MGLQLTIWSQPTGGTLLADLTRYVQRLSWTTGEHGFELLRADVAIPHMVAAQIYDRAGLPHVEVSLNGLRVWEGRLEDPALWTAPAIGGIRIGALGYWRSLSDIPYTALWSTTSVADWRIQTRDIYGTTAHAERFEQDNRDGRIYMTPKKNESFGNSPAVLGFWGYIIPDRSTRKIVGLQFDYDFLAPTNWRVLVQSRDGTWGTASATLLTLNGSGAAQTASLNLVISETDRITIRMDFNAANAVYTGETGDAYIRITNLRIVTATTNRVNTTFTNNETAGSGVSIEVPTTAGMYAGQRLIIASGSTSNSESILVTSVTSSTAFVADIAMNHTAGQTIQGHVIYADEIVKDLATAVNAVNSTQLQTNATLIQSPGWDLTDEIYEDTEPADIIAHLIQIGDSSSPPRIWEAGMWWDRLLYFRPQLTGTQVQTWYADVSELELERSLDELANSAYAVYEDADSHTLRTATATDTASVSRYGVTRRQAPGADATSATQAGVVRDTVIQDRKNPPARADFEFSMVRDAYGGSWPLCMVRAGDIMVLRNLPITLGADVDRIRSFRISSTSYDAVTNTLRVEPEAPIPTLVRLRASAPAPPEEVFRIVRRRPVPR